MPIFGRLLKRRTKHSKGSSSKGLQSTTTSSSITSNSSTNASTSKPTPVSPSSNPTPPHHLTSSCPHPPSATAQPASTSPPIADTRPPASAPAVGTPSSTPTTSCKSTPATTTTLCPTDTSVPEPMSAQPTPQSPSMPGDGAQLKGQPHHPHHHHQNVASIKNLINPPHHEDLSSRVPGEGQQYHGMQNQEQHPAVQSQPRQLKGKYSLEDFALRRTLGTGSFGRVHLVQSKHNQRFYAMKVLKKAQVVKMKQVEHTNDERKMLSRVKHPFLITLWGTFQDPKNLYMVMDFVEGGELFSLLRKSQRFPNPVAKFYAAEVTLALDYLHTQDIVYRDLKPENLLLDRHGHLKITDFGFAKEVTDITWTLCGTPDYLAPEVVSSKGYNKSVDWWSLGILIYEMLCGFTPFWDSGSPMKIYENILQARVKYPPYMHPDAQDLLSQLITADLTKRLGNLHAGSMDVKSHPWFAEVTWDRLLSRDIDAPYIPPIKAGQGDASQFDSYPEETERYGAEGDDEYGHYFQEF